MGEMRACSICPASPSPAARSATISPAAKVHLPDVIHPLDGAALCRRRDRGADRQSGAARLRDEACRRRPALSRASRQGDRVRELRPHGARGRARRSRRHAGPYSGAEERRPEGRPRHAGMGHAADPEEAPQSRRARHGAYFRCAHERHQLRRLHPACGAGELCRRPARFGADRRRDRDRRRRAAHSSARRRRGAGAPARRLEAAAAALRTGLRRDVFAAYRPGRRRLRLRFSRRPAPIAEPEIH